MSVVVAVRNPISQEDLDGIRHVLDEWDGKKPLIVAEGTSVSLIGGLTFRVLLQAGPHDGLQFTINVGSLSELPYAFDVSSGQYVRSDLVTTDGDPVYSWAPA